MMKNKINVIFLSRKKSKFIFSIEMIFDSLEKNIYKITNDIKIYTRYNRFQSKGIFSRLLDTIIVKFLQKDINHITGDIHYLALFLDPKKTILTIHDCGILKKSKGLKFIIYYIFWYWIPEKRVSYITVISETIKKELLEYLKCEPSKIKVIHNSLTEGFKKKYISFDEKCPNILHIGFTKNKNLKNHIMAIRNLKCKLTIIGKPSSE